MVASRKFILDTLEMKNDIPKTNLKTQLGNIGFPHQDTTTGQIWALDQKLIARTWSFGFETHSSS